MKVILRFYPMATMVAFVVLVAGQGQSQLNTMNIKASTQNLTASVQSGARSAGSGRGKNPVPRSGRAIEKNAAQAPPPSGDVMVWAPFGNCSMNYLGCQEGGAPLNLINPVTIQSWTLYTPVKLSGCTTLPVLSLVNGASTLGTLTMSNGGQTYAGTLTNTAVPAASSMQVEVTTAGVGCTPAGSALNNNITYTMQAPAGGFGVQAANTVLAGPSSGSTGATPAARALVAADLPAFGGIDYSSQFASIASAITDGATTTHVVDNDGLTAGGFSNSSNVPLMFNTLQHFGRGFVMPEEWGAYGDGVHDDTAAIQSCWNYSGTANVTCSMIPASGIYLINSGLTIATHMNAQGSSFVNGTTLKCEFNGDCISLQNGPIQGVTLRNFDLKPDPALVSSRGIHLNATVNSTYAFGGLFDSVLDNVEVDYPALECLWMDGGGGPGYTFNLPNQYVTFFHFNCNGANQAHPAYMIKMTGQNAQIMFINGAINGGATVTNYPNALISAENKTPGLNDGPEDITFIGYTYEVGSVGLNVKFSNSIRFIDGYIESIASPLLASSSSGLDFSSNYIANSGTSGGVAQYTGNVTGDFRDNVITVDPNHTVASLATCTNNTNTVIMSNNTSPVSTTASCATVQQGIASSTLTAVNSTVLLNGDGGATPISTLVSPTPAGGTQTLYAFGASFNLASGGNIAFGAFPSPLAIPAGSLVTLRRLDLGPAFVIESVSGGIPQTTSIRTGVAKNTDLGGQLTLTSGKINYAFAGRYTSAPICTASDTTAASPVRVVTTPTILTITGTGSDVVNYVCVGRD